MAPTSRSHSGRGAKASKFKRYKPRRSRGVMKRTTRKGAYNKTKKSNFQKRRAPMVETKSRTHEDVRVDFPELPDRNELVTYDTPHLALNPDSFLALTQGLREDQMIGRALYSRYLNMKIKIRFPQHAFTIDGSNKIVPRFPQNYELIWGWIPMATGYTGSTTPTAPTADINDIHNHINLRVVDYYNDKQDFLRFIPKKASTLRITGSRKVRPDLRRYSTAPLQNSDEDEPYVGSIPDYDTQISWKTKKKIHYEPSVDLEGEGNDRKGFYVNYQWTPFCVLVNWDYNIITDLHGTDPSKANERKKLQPAVAWNDIHYFSDS